LLNSTNINKTNESVNSAGQQFHQYQQNKESVNSAGQFVLLILVELLTSTVYTFFVGLIVV
jgi:hypothetical protein